MGITFPGAPGQIPAVRRQQPAPRPSLTPLFGKDTPSDKADIKSSFPWDQMDKAEKVAVGRLAKDYTQFLQKAVSDTFTNREIIRRAEEQGFKPFPNHNLKALKPGEKYYFNSNNYRAVGLVVIGKNSAITKGMNVIAAHTDAPQFELKPGEPSVTNGVITLKTKPWGGMLATTWFSKAVGLAAQVFNIPKDENGNPAIDPSTGRPAEPENKFVRVRNVGALIPPAPHIDARESTDNRTQKFNLETEAHILAGVGGKDDKTLLDRFKTALKQRGIENFQDGRFFLYPEQGPQEMGIMDNNLILAHGHDDRSLCYAGASAIFNAAQGNNAPLQTAVALFVNNEETGSNSNDSATSRWVEDVLRRTVEGQLGEAVGETRFNKALKNTFLISADVGHGWLPTHARYFDTENAGRLGYGPVITPDVRGNFATTGEGIATIKALAKLAGVPNVQVTGDRLDKGGGTTIGPMIAAKLQAKVVDMGIPLSGMHAAGEVIHKADLYLATKLFSRFLRGDNDFKMS